jgi:hypothetical protein
LKRVTPTSGLPDEVCAQQEVEEPREQDVDVAGAKEEARHRGHPLEMVLVDCHVLAGEHEDQKDGYTEDEMKSFQGGYCTDIEMLSILRFVPLPAIVILAVAWVVLGDKKSATHQSGNEWRSFRGKKSRRAGC